MPENAQPKIDATEDEKVFGADKLVYCAEHLAVHTTGWCTVRVHRKVMLPTQDLTLAVRQCMDMGLKLFRES